MNPGFARLYRVALMAVSPGSTRPRPESATRDPVVSTIRELRIESQRKRFVRPPRRLARYVARHENFLLVCASFRAIHEQTRRRPVFQRSFHLHVFTPIHRNEVGSQ